MTAPQNVIAVIFDFDDTLTDDSTTKLLEANSIDPKQFWGTKNAEMVKQGWDPTLSYLHLLLDNVGDQALLGRLTNRQLREFGATLEFYPGIPEIFDNLRKVASEHSLSHPSVEFYVISGGLEEIILGSKISTYLSGVRGCRFAEREGVIYRVMNAVTFTEKTRYIFEINKGVMGNREHPYAVNEAVEESARRVPLSNMIYIGDGLTDVPCFSLIGRAKGRAFGIFDPRKEGSPKKALEKLLTPARVSTLNSPRYRTDDDLGSLLISAVRSKCTDLDLQTRAPISYS